MPRALGINLNSPAPGPRSLGINLSAPEQQTNPLEAAALGLGQGVTMGFGDELNGVVGGGLDAALPESFGGAKSGTPFLDLYRQNRDMARRLNAQAALEHPAEFTGGAVAGGLAGGALVPGAAAGLGGALKAGAALGAANGLGASNADLTSGSLDDAGQAVKDTGAGGLLGVGGALVGHGLGVAAGKFFNASGEGLSDAAKGFANKQAVGTLKATPQQYRKLGPKGVDSLGEFLLADHPDLGAAVKFARTSDSISETLQGLKAAAGAELDKVLPELDAAGASAGLSGLDKNQVTSGIQQMIADELKKGPKGAPVANALQKEMDDFVMQVPVNISFTEAEGIKRGYWEAAKQALSKALRDRTAQDKVDIALGSLVKDQIETQAEQAAKAVLDPTLFDRFSQAKKMWGLSEQALSMTSGAESRALARNIASPSDKLAALTEMSAARDAGASPAAAGLKAAAAGVLNNQVRRRAGSALAVAADAASTKLQRLAMTSPGKLGEYGAVLSGALQRGGQDAFNAHAYVLSQTDPKFQALQQKLAAEKDDDHGQ